MATLRQIAVRAWQVFRPTWKDLLLSAVASGLLVLLYDIPWWVCGLTLALACILVPAVFGWLELVNEAADQPGQDKPASEVD